MLAEDIRTAVAAYIHDRLARECDEAWGRGAAIARATGLTPAHVANVKNGKAAAGPDLARQLARYWEMSEPELEAAATAWFEARGRPVRNPRPATVRWTELDSRYPNLAEAIAILRREGEVDASLLDEIEHTKLRSETDLPVTTWWRMIELEANHRRRQSREVPAEPTPRRLSAPGLSVAQQMQQAREAAGISTPGSEGVDTTSGDAIVRDVVVARPAGIKTKKRHSP